MIMSNIVTGKKLKKAQRDVLNDIASVVSNTAGPYGSSTMILHNQAVNEFSKDGHKVLSNIQYFHPIERAVHDELLNITSYVVRNVGDGTTSAVQLSNIIFGKLCDYLEEHEEIQPRSIVDALEKVTSKIAATIKEKAGAEMTLDDVYNICMIATNGNVQVSKDIKDIYKKMGNNVYIEINTSNSVNTVAQTYDGIYLDKGFPNSAYINTEDGTCDIQDAKIYYFEDNVDDPEMINLFMSIVMNNMYNGYQNKTANYVPTLILAPMISQDLKSSLAQIESIMHSFDTQEARMAKPPFCVVTGINSNDDINDIVMLCDCPRIKKYINPEVHDEAVKRGDAPTVENVMQFCGSAERVVITNDTSKFINPAKMFTTDDEGNKVHTDVYTGLLNHIKSELKAAEEVRDDITLIGKLRRQLNHLEANYVEYFVGGVATSDRDNVKDLVEDAVLNCRSAAINGVGYGCNFEGLLASEKVNDSYKPCDCTSKAAAIQYNLESDIACIIHESYHELIASLYRTAFVDEESVRKLNESIEKKMPVNLRTKSFKDPVLCSLDSDPIILEAVTKITSVLVLSNQALVQEPTRNVYLKMDDED